MIIVFPTYHFLGGIFLGWSIGGMDFSVLFGAAVSSKMVKYWNAVILACVFCFLGAIFQGFKGVETLSALTTQSLTTAIISSVAAALTITVLNLLKLPVPTSQAVIGSIAGIGIMSGNFHTQGLLKIVLCWLIAPIIAFLIAIPLYIGFSKLYNSFNFNIFQRNIFLRISLIVAGCYAAYALGANATANIAGVFVGSGTIDVNTALFIGAGSIALGMITFSRRVSEVIGKGIVKLDSYSALIAVLGEAITVHIFAFAGVPVSMTQALVGSIIGIGVLRGYKSIRIRKLTQILWGWIIAPVAACIVSSLLFIAVHLKYVAPQ